MHGEPCTTGLNIRDFALDKAPLMPADIKLAQSREV
jgi:hypothetical protein